MDRTEFKTRLQSLLQAQEALVARRNRKAESGNGIFDRYLNPVLTAAHAPVFWRYDLSYETNPHLLGRRGTNAAFTCGALEFSGKVVLAVRVEGSDRKSFLAIAESANGID